MLIDNPSQNLPKYQQVYAVKDAGRLKLFATQVDQQEGLPARWDFEASENAADLSNVVAFTPIICEIKEPLTTETLIKKAQVEGYGDWQTNEEKVH